MHVLFSCVCVNNYDCVSLCLSVGCVRMYLSVYIGCSVWLVCLCLFVPLECFCVSLCVSVCEVLYTSHDVYVYVSLCVCVPESTY